MKTHSTVLKMLVSARIAPSTRQLATKSTMPMAMHRTTFPNTQSLEFCISSSTNGRDFKLKDHNGIQIEPSCRWVVVARSAIWVINRLEFAIAPDKAKHNFFSFLSRLLVVNISSLAPSQNSLAHHRSISLSPTFIQKMLMDTIWKKWFPVSVCDVSLTMPI